MDKIDATYSFDCPECGKPCISRRLKDAEGGLRIVNAHSGHSCGLFAALNEAEFLMAALTKRNELKVAAEGAS